MARLRAARWPRRGGTSARRGAARLRLHLQAGFEGLEPAGCDLALVRLPRGRALQEEALALAAAMLRPGGRLDDGAAALIAGMEVTPGARILDLGCGTGLVGLAALRRGAEVAFTDVSARAVASTQRTLAANGFSGAEVHQAIGATAFAADSFDSVLANPPFHRGHGIDLETAEQFISESARVLRSSGTLYLVANAFLPYTAWIEAHFARVATVWRDDRFRVWKAVR